MTARLGAAYLIFLALTAAPPALGVPVLRSAACRSTAISLSEAEILVYVMPPSVAIRQRGRDVAWELNTSRAWDQSDYYLFRVVFTGPTRGSRLVGNYAVNKRTADLVDVSAEYRLVTSKQLRGVQRILRQEHSIGRATILKYRYVNPATGRARLTPKELSLPAAH